MATGVTVRRRFTEALTRTMTQDEKIRQERSEAADEGENRASAVSKKAHRARIYPDLNRPNQK